MAIKKNVRIDTKTPSLSYLGPYEQIIDDMWKYIRQDINGNWVKAFLPLTGGLLEQEANWVNDVEVILRCLNAKG